MNWDGHDDLVWQHTDGRVVVWSMTNTTMTSWSYVVSVPGSYPGWHVVAVR